MKICSQCFAMEAPGMPVVISTCSLCGADLCFLCYSNGAHDCQPDVVTNGNAHKNGTTVTERTARAIPASRLDINTPKGREAFHSQLKAIEIVLEDCAESVSFIHTPGDGAALVDGFIVKGDTLVGIAEVKSRDMTHEQLFGKFNGEWLLTHQKLEDMATLCRMLQVPGYGVLYLIPSEIVLTIKLCDSLGNIVCKHRAERTETQATVNGGKANRLNAYIAMQTAKSHKTPVFMGD